MISSIVYPGTILGLGVVLGEFVVIGVPPSDPEPAVPVRIGERAVIRSHTVIYAGNVIGADFQTGHGVMIREHNNIGERVSIGTHSIVEHHVTLGNGVRIHSNAFIPEFTVVEDDTWIGPHAVLTNAKYPRSPGAKTALKGPRIRSGAIVGAGVILLPGVTVGHRALIGAGSVVVRDVPDFQVVVGNPARVINDVRNLPDYNAVPTIRGELHP